MKTNINQDIDEMVETIEWAVETITEKHQFGLGDTLNSSRAREMRAKGVLVDCRKVIQKLQEENHKLKQKLNDINEIVEKYNELHKKLEKLSWD